MKISNGHLTYCSNIHPGATWDTHFQVLQENFPSVKQQFSPNQSLALGLRLANEASIHLQQPSELASFKEWLVRQDSYVYTMNGFPYGAFHGTRVKDQVHSPDWTTKHRRDYTLRLFQILQQLLPSDLSSGSISTSPLSYKYWFPKANDLDRAKEQSTHHLLNVIENLDQIYQKSGQCLHLDIEPEPDGILSNVYDFIQWYQEFLIPQAFVYFKKYNKNQIRDCLFRHLKLCYDTCHFAVEFNEAKTAITALKNAHIDIGKVQISAALEVDLSDNVTEKIRVLENFNEPVYLHQVVIQLPDGQYERYPDLDEALEKGHRDQSLWRIHFHVPIFLEQYGLLSSTQSDLETTLELFQQENLCDHFEVETYTWDVLPQNLRGDLNESISRELTYAFTRLEKQ